MLLAGVAVSFFLSSVILFIQYMSGLVHSLRIVRWTMGGLEITGYADVLTILPFVVTGVATIVFLGRELNLLATGEDIAASRGVNVQRVKLALFAFTSLTVAGVVAVCGPIGFVGMMVPHICRLLVGSDHRTLAPASLLFGGTFLVVCERLAQGVIPGVPVPVGVLTALLGGPFFVWLLVRRGPGGVLS
jgi:iron complex transport system permease protein